MTIRFRFTLVSILSILVVAALLIGAWQLSEQAAQKRYTEATITAKSVLWNKVLQSYFQRLAPEMKTVTRDRALLNALRKGDTAKLVETSQTTHNTLSGLGLVDRFQVFDLEGQYLVSVPAGMSGATDKDLVRQTIDERKVKQGLSYDDDGQLMAVMSFPLFARGKFKGVAVYEKALQSMVDDFVANDQSEVSIIDLNQSTLYKDMASSEQDHDFNTTDLQLNDLSVHDSNGQIYFVSMIPLTSLSGEILAHLIAANDHTESYSEQVNLTYGSFISVFVVVLIVSFGTYQFGRYTFKPLDKVVDAMNNISQGDLTTCSTISNHKKDEVGKITQGMCHMVDHLRVVIQNILDASTEMTSAADDLLSRSEDVNQLNLRQMNKNRDISDAINEMNNNICVIEKRTNHAASSAKNVEENINAGHQLITSLNNDIEDLKARLDDAMAAIKQLDANGKDIEGILAVIRGIADQTSLLALNASIEAARAGEHGRGFAVVADEVRGLANRTQKSTSEIDELIASLTTGTNQAVELIARGDEKTKQTAEHSTTTLNRFKEIKASADEINQLNQEIANAIIEQAQFTSRLEADVIDVKQDSELASEHSENTAMAGRQLSELSSKLAQSVSHFRLN